MRGQIKLPPGDAIDIFDFCSSIAEAFCPTEPLEGIHCIVGGLIRVPAASGEDRLSIPPAVATMVEATFAAAYFSPSEIAESDITKREFPCQPFRNEAGDVALPVVLTDDDWLWLEGVLPKLPRLRHPISDKEAEMFLTAYRGLPARRAWEPSLITDVSRRKKEHDNVFMLHRNALERVFEEGGLIAFDRQHRPVPALTVRSLISRSTAVAYLERNGLTEFNEQQLSPRERRKAIVDYWKHLEGEGETKRTALTAARFGVSTSLVRRYVREDKAAKETSIQSPFQTPRKK